MDNLNYEEIFQSLIKISGNEISKFEQLCLLIHSIFLKKDIKPFNKESLIENWNRDFYKIVFYYTTNQYKKIQLEIINDKINEKANIILKLFQEFTTEEIISNLSLKDEMIKKLDYNRINETIQELENFIEINFIFFIKKQINNNSNNNNNNFNNNNNNNNNIFSNSIPYNQNYYMNNNNTPYSNPFFSSNGVPGGNLVGPNSDIFNRQNPFQNQKIKYDPIGPFGTFGGPNSSPPNFFPTNNNPFDNPFNLNNNINYNPGGFGKGFPFNKYN